MKHLETFEAFNTTPNDMIFEEWKLPTYQDTIKRKLSFLKKMDISELEPIATHTNEIKELWKKMMKVMYTKEKARKYIKIVEDSNVHHLKNTFDIIKQIKNSLEKDQGVGQILYNDKSDKIYYYEKPLEI